MDSLCTQSETAMPQLAFRLTSNLDPEERLEEAALWKAMHDEYGEDIRALREGEQVPAGISAFGRAPRNASGHDANPVGERLDYWNDKAFLNDARRRTAVVPFERVSAEVNGLHADGLGAFVKSTRAKHAIFRIPVGESVSAAIGEMAYSFIDGGPLLMVQELCHVRMEHRFFCIDREIVTDSPVQWALTPLDHPLPPGTAFATPKSKLAHPDAGAITAALTDVARRVARDMKIPHAAIDCALINGVPGVIELNPMRLGQLGLYAADVRALARASRKLLVRLRPDADPPVPEPAALDP